jgi:hypothetical protein
LETDVLTVKHLAQYLCNHKVGCNFQRIEVVLGDYDKDNHGDMDIERPTILFTCHIQLNGDILIEDDRHTVQDPCWEQYLDVDKTSNIPGFTYPQNLEQWIRDGEEADLILSRLEEISDQDEIGPLLSGSRANPQNLGRWNEQGEEAGQVLVRSEKTEDEDDIDSLFGDSLNSENEGE